MGLEWYVGRPQLPRLSVLMTTLNYMFYHALDCIILSPVMCLLCRMTYRLLLSVKSQK